MRQIWMMRRGGPEVLEVREAIDPEPGAHEVRVRVKAAGVNCADILIRIGLYPTAPKLPAVVGYEVSGVVDAVGQEVSKDLLGQRILALMPRYGGYSVISRVNLVLPHFWWFGSVQFWKWTPPFQCVTEF